MSSGWSPRVEIDGGEATAEQLGVPALVNYGHFTAMQVRKGAVRGLELHMRRLRTATRELFGVDLDADRVRDHLRHALGHGVGDASARITVFQPEPGSGVSVLVALRPAVGMPAMPQAPQAVPYQRPLPHIKHVGTFGQIHYGRLAERHGFDDALLTGADGIVAEAAISNIGFLDDTGVVWPDAPALLGITMQLLDRRLAGSGVRSRRAPVRLADLPAYAGAFVTNSRGVAPVGRIDDLALPVGSGLLTRLSELYEGVPWETP